MSEAWTPQTARLKFFVGEKNLGTARLPALVATGHFTGLSPEPPLPPEFPGRVKAVKIPSCPVPGRLPRITWQPGVIRYVVSQYRRYYINMAQTFDQYLAHFSGKSRSTLKRKVRKFADASGGPIDVREFRRPEEIEAFYGQARLVSAKTYQERLLHAGLPEGEQFTRELLHLAGQDAVRGYLLYYEGKPISYLCCPIENGVVFYQHVGYDPAYEQFSPGTVLLYLALERLFAEGRYKVFDFTEGEGPHKESFGDRSTFCADLLYLRRSCRNVALVLFHTAFDGSLAGAKWLLTKSGLKARLKKFLRRQA